MPKYSGKADMEATFWPTSHSGRACACLFDRNPLSGPGADPAPHGLPRPALDGVRTHGTEITSLH